MYEKKFRPLHISSRTSLLELVVCCVTFSRFFSAKNVGLDVIGVDITIWRKGEAVKYEPSCKPTGLSAIGIIV